jgi:hypothetical protein
MLNDKKITPASWSARSIVLLLCRRVCDKSITDSLQKEHGFMKEPVSCIQSGILEPLNMRKPQIPDKEKSVLFRRVAVSFARGTRYAPPGENSDRFHCRPRRSLARKDRGYGNRCWYRRVADSVAGCPAVRCATATATAPA